MTKFRKGDIVTIEATIASTPFNMDDGKAKVKIEFPPFHDAYVDPADLTMLRPKIEIGDVVRLPLSEGPADGKSRIGTVLSIASDHVWVDIGGGDFATWWLAKVQRVDPEPAAEAEAA